SKGDQGFARGDTYKDVEDVFGSDFNDTLIGDDGNNLLSGGKGNDTLDGGANTGNVIDIADYSYTGTALSVTLNGTTSSFSNFTVTGGSGDTDTVRNVEGLIGGSGADTIIGDSLANYLDGGVGNDSLVGGSSDSLFGGAGNDMLKLDWSSINYKIDGGTGTDTVSFAGSTSDISLSGSSFSNLLSNAEYLDFSGTQGSVSLSLGGDDVQKLLTGSSSSSSYAGVLDVRFDTSGDSLSLLNNGSYSYWNSSDVNATTGKFNDGTNFSITGSTQQYVYVFDTNHTTLLATLYLHT
ncbi:MAG: calcium-binding protein, partial [Hyphomicrobiales bacterium]